MPLQFQGVAIHALPGAREGRPDGLHPFLEPAAPALEDPEPYVGPGLPEKREVNSEPVVLPRRWPSLAEEFGQLLLAIGVPFSSPSTASSSTPERLRPTLPPEARGIPVCSGSMPRCDTSAR